MRQTALSSHSHDERSPVSRFFRTVSPAMAVACIALAVALGGTGYAAVVLPANSVGTAQLKANAVTGAKVKDGSLTPADLRGGLADVVVRTDRVSNGPGLSSVTSQAACEPGEVAIGAGISLDNGAGGTVKSSYPLVGEDPFYRPAKDGDTPTAWRTEFAFSLTAPFVSIHYVLCLRA